MQTVSDRTLTAANSILLMRVKGFNDNFVQIEEIGRASCRERV